MPAEAALAQVRQDIADFIAKLKDEGVDLKALEVRGNLANVLDGLADVYHLGDLLLGPPESMKIPHGKMVKLVTEAGLVLATEHAKLLPYQTFLVFRKP